jgi:hypothetical protein
VGLRLVSGLLGERQRASNSYARPSFCANAVFNRRRPGGAAKIAGAQQ